MPNTRILNDNASDRATLSASNSASGTAIGNVKTNRKGMIWESTTNTPQITATFAQNESIGVVIMPICNLSATATVRVRCYSDAGGTTLIAGSDTGTVSAVPAPINAFSNWITAPLGVNGFAYGSGAYAIVWLAAQYTNVRHVKIDFVDTAPVQLSRLVLGKYYELNDNPDDEILFEFVSKTVRTRNDAGDVENEMGVIYKQLTLPTSFFQITDRKNLIEIIRKNNMSYPLFISVMPNDTDKLTEHTLSIFGFLTELSKFKIRSFGYNASSITIEEF